MFDELSAIVSFGVRLTSVNVSFVDLSGRSHYSDTMLAGVDGTRTNDSSMNSTQSLFLSPDRPRGISTITTVLGSPDEVALREGLSTSNGPTEVRCFPQGKMPKTNNQRP